MNSIVRILGGVAMALASLNAFLLGLSGDAVPQDYIILIGAANAAVGAAVAFLSKPPVDSRGSTD
jgi:hypothetical protein